VFSETGPKSHIPKNPVYRDSIEEGASPGVSSMV
jgi:hypothetical protein